MKLEDPYSFEEEVRIGEILPLILNADCRQDPDIGLTPEEISRRTGIPLAKVHASLRRRAHRRGPIQESEKNDGTGTGRFRRTGRAIQAGESERGP